jgi:hypothetical protein
MAPKTQAGPKTQAAPKAPAKPAPKAEIKDMTVTARPALPVHKPSGRSAQASLLFLVGLGATLMGLAMALGPKLSLKVDKLVEGWNYLGVHSGTLVAGGLVLLGLAMVLRQVSQVSAMAAQASEDTSLLESVAADVLQVGSVIEGVQASIRGVSGEIGGLHSAIAAVGEQAAAAQPKSDSLGSDDAIFRLAASLDKVGAKIEERLKTQFGDLTERLGKLETSVAETARRLERSQTPPPAMPAAQAPRSAPYPTPALHQTAHYAQPHPAAPGAYPQQAPAPYGHPGGHPGAHPGAHHPSAGLQVTPMTPPAHPQMYAAENPKSLGLLDHLDDNGVPAAVPPAAQMHFDAAPPQLSLADMPVQADPWGQQPGIPMNPVMSDPQVRAALEDMGRQGRGR